MISASFIERRQRMVREQIAGRGVRDQLVLAAMSEVPRERFVSAGFEEYAYDDSPLPIEEGQTISQPYVVAVMIEAARVRPEHRVLEVGAGSGYAAAVLGRIAAEVFALEWHHRLTRRAQRRIEALGYDNVTIRHGDGTLGWAEHAPFNAIIVSAGGGPDVPPPLLEQLALDGRLVIPVGDGARGQELMSVHRLDENNYDFDALGRVQFVPLVGKGGRHRPAEGST